MLNDDAIAVQRLPERTASIVRDNVPIRASTITIIEPRSGWRLVDWRELIEYRDLFRFLVWRGIKVRYAQSAIGVG